MHLGEEPPNKRARFDNPQDMMGGMNQFQTFAYPNVSENDSVFYNGVPDPNGEPWSIRANTRCSSACVGTQKHCE